ncbi:hypothetical protein FOQG_00233 [Fusarium oxysporum f. sp. raphani 54005]|uniref:Uncharacterized protein n=2 Tax=Fusarium oxysporum f. sp. raphani TaxID=96318 RepID=X0CZ91_FUSOX|nr:hypothetical protein FOQG_00233 [Fusarium oxysporum f. sp. raphani 54005]KAG7436730.1 hypothetical protein Forpi1262_v002574 [Fusarium oxysporum f. sp. raphani]
MLHALIAAQEDDVKRWSSCPSFGPFTQKLFFQSQNVSHLWTIHPTGCASLEQSEYSGDIKAIDAKTPVDSVATLTLRSPSDGKPFPVPIREILAKFYEYGQRKLHRVCVAIRFDNKTIRYVDIQAFPSEDFPKNRNKEQLKEIDIIYSIGDEYSRLECQHEYQKLNAQTAFEEHLEIIGNRMRDNGYNIKVHVPDQLVQTEVKYCEELASKSESGSFNLGAYMDEIYFLPLIHSAVLGTIKSGEFAIFEADDTGDIYLRKNHKVDNRFLSTPATKMN